MVCQHTLMLDTFSVYVAVICAHGCFVYFNKNLEGTGQQIRPPSKSDRLYISKSPSTLPRNLARHGAGTSAPHPDFPL